MFRVGIDLVVSTLFTLFLAAVNRKIEAVCTFKYGWVVEWWSVLIAIACCCPCSVAKARGSHLRVHFKHMREVAHTIKGMKVVKAKAFLNDVLQFKRAVPFTRCVAVLGLSCFTIHVWGSF